MPFTASDCFRLKYFYILERAGETVLSYTLNCGTYGKTPSVSFEDYLRSLPPTSTANYNKISNNTRRKYFTQTDLNQITSHTSCDNFDITLLHKLIKIACENVAGMNDASWKSESDEVEYLVTKVKDTRNEIVHEKLVLSEQEFYVKIQELKNVIVRTLEATKVRYGRDNSEFQGKRDDIMMAIDNMTKETLGKEEILQRSVSQFLPLFKTETNKQLLDCLSYAKCLDPLHFLSGHENNQVDVQTVFSRIEMMTESRNSSSEETLSVEYLKLLNLTQPGNPSSHTVIQKPQVLVIEGDAGSGKTTLITFVLSEWLQNDSDRRMEGLIHYDLLLWVMCSEQTNTTFDDMLSQALPDVKYRYGNLLLPLLKHCRVLVIIDGLDERTKNSHQLVADILNEGREAANFTAVCTSRPEAVTDFKATVPKKYQISHVKILGISPDERPSVIIKHYKWLMRGRSGNIERLRQLIKETSWMELFRLPLNLLFLATMFFYDRTSANPALIQSQLYNFIVTWSVEKLQDRLAKDASLPSRNFRQKKVKTVLKSIYWVALQGLLQNRIFLTEEDEDFLNESCNKEGLPREEVMQAFFVLRRHVTSGHTTEWYRAPHKGIQEHFAARHIFEQLSDYTQGDIKRVLQEALRGQELRLAPLRNMLCHLLGMLVQVNNSTTAAVKEVVDLIQESGVKTTERWLHMLTDTGTNTAILKRVAEHQRSLTDNDGDVVVTDTTVFAATALLPLLSKKKIYIRLEREPAGLDALLQALPRHTVVSVWLAHQYNHPHSTTAASGHLFLQVSGEDLKKFKGHLKAKEHLQLLPQGLTHLSVVLAGSDHARSLLPALSDALSLLTDLYNLTIHVPVKTVTPDALVRLPATDTSVFLTLSGVGDDEVEVAWRIAAALCPSKKGLWDIYFPAASLRTDGWRRLINGLAEAGVRVGATLYVPESTISLNEHLQLFSFTESLLGCQLRRSSAEWLWQ
ncbi:uncharacterized protein LOC135092875 isoform X1 [Scylla paramamosain]|uniref:uncharacterized protein LOC135092875 isoform X1 n=1 Tax=Scylla paramamosain TaxID=85552 RepID=UPI0030839021